jgi:hypothetical protein
MMASAIQRMGHPPFFPHPFAKSAKGWATPGAPTTMMASAIQRMGHPRIARGSQICALCMRTLFPHPFRKERERMGHPATPPRFFTMTPPLASSKG